MSAESLQRALGALGIDCIVEARDRLAVIILANASADFTNPSTRRNALALLAEHGFTHVALEITDTPPGNAAVSGD